MLKGDSVVNSQLADLIIITEEKSKAKERKHRESLEM